MDVESHASLKEIDALFHWRYRAGSGLCRLVVTPVGGLGLEKAISVFRIRTQCGHVSVQAPRLLLDFTAGIPEFANPFRVFRQLALPELPGGVTNIIERYTDVWAIRYPQFRALLDTAFHARNMTGPDSDADRFLGYLRMQEVGDCLRFQFNQEE